jgi:hypothetical protein
VSESRGVGTGGTGRRAPPTPDNLEMEPAPENKGSPERHLPCVTLSYFALKNPDSVPTANRPE